MPPFGHGPQSLKKEKLDPGALKKLLVYVKKYIPIIIVSIIFSIGSAVISIISPSIVSDLTDVLMGGLTTPSGVDMSLMWQKATLLIILYSLGALLTLISGMIMAYITQKTGKSLRTSINEKLNKLPLKYFDTTTRGDILSIVTNDVDTICQSLNQTVNNLFSAFFLFFGIVIAMFVVNYILAFVTLGASIIGFIMIMVLASKSRKHFRNRQNDLAKMNGHVEEIFTNHLVVQSYNGEDDAIEKFKGINKRLFKDNFVSQSLGGSMMPVMNFSGNLAYALVFIVGVSLSLNASSSVTFGTIMQFIIYARLFSQPLQTFSQSIASLQQASAASGRVFNLLEQNEIIDETNKTYVPKTIEGNVTFDNVHFGYDPEKEIIHGFSAKLKAGQKVAIVGPTGAGKTTIVNLLMRFYDIDSGHILIDDTSTNDMNRDNVRKMFDMILQDTWLFNGTVKENLVFNNKNISQEQLDDAINEVGLRHFIESLPYGYDTYIDDSLALSEGQKQQLTIARAILKDAPLLILDEATSSVDTRTELIIQEAMDKLTKGRTSFVIAHRLSTIKNADVILVVKDGDIIEQGDHNSLLKKNGFYAELYNSQFAVFD